MNTLFIFLQLLNVWVSNPTNDTDVEIFSNSLLKKTTSIVVEEYIQQYTNLRLVNSESEADVIVSIQFIEYIRPNTEISFLTLRSKTETVGLTMIIEFYYPKYNYTEPIRSTSTLDKEIRSNFLSVEESETDFSNSMLMNLIKKTISEGFENTELLF